MNDGSNVLGRDLMALYRVTDGRHEDVDLETSSRAAGGELLTDVVVTSGIDAAVQAVVHKIKTMRGELTDLGHADYGSRHHELIGEPNSENNRNLVKLYILQALAEEPRIETIHRVEVVHDRRRAPDRVDIVLDLSFIGRQVPTNLVIPFSFGGSA
jgi:phage baseplate assembly protein W